jgi:hypothetical protein
MGADHQRQVRGTGPDFQLGDFLVRPFLNLSDIVHYAFHWFGS